MLSFKVQCSVPAEIRARNTALSKGYPAPSGSGRLAVVGGGPSLLEHLGQLRSWRGDIWAINGAAQWCARNGIKAALYSLDAGDDLGPMCEGIDVAVFASHCDPSAYEALKGKTVYQVSADNLGPTSAAGATLLAIEAGYTHVTFFGCESSYAETTHVYDCGNIGELIWVSGFRTKPEFLLQAEQLAKVIRHLPQFYSERSGGLLSALIVNPDYEITHVARSIYNRLVE